MKSQEELVIQALRQLPTSSPSPRLLARTLARARTVLKPAAPERLPLAYRLSVAVIPSLLLSAGAVRAADTAWVAQNFEQPEPDQGDPGERPPAGLGGQVEDR